MSPSVNLHRYFFAAALIWIVAMTWRVYPQFKDSLRSEGRVVTLDEYVEDACGERVGPLATSCRAATLEKGRQLVASQQAKSLLVIELPLMAYVLLYLPARFFMRWRRSS